MYFHANYRPFRVGDRVQVEEGILPFEHRTARVTRLSKPDAYGAEETQYFLTFEDETAECETPFNYFDLFGVTA